MSGNKRAYAVELDGNFFRLSGNRLEPISDVNDLVGDHWLISDMQESISRTMTVEVESKYAELIVDRNLRESGDFDESVTVIAHRKEKKAVNQRIYFSRPYRPVFTTPILIEYINMRTVFFYSQYLQSSTAC